MTVSDCKRQGADQPSTRAGWSVPLLFTTMNVLKHFVDVHYYIVSIFVRFLLYVVYEFVLCSPYLEDNKVSIYLSVTLFKQLSLYKRYTNNNGKVEKELNSTVTNQLSSHLQLKEPIKLLVDS